MAFVPAIEELSRAVRRVVDLRVPALTGADLGRIDITVEDIASAGD